MKVYYTFWGRNAWWTTWITRYQEGCIHTDLESAQLYCEGKRVQGTVFYVNELPALSFEHGATALLVSEINTDKVLSRFNGEKAQCVLNQQFPFSTVTLEQLGCVFNALSEFWDRGYPTENAVIQTVCADAENLQSISKSTKWTAWRSYAYGAKYRLGWVGGTSGIGRASVVSLAEAFESLRVRGSFRFHPERD